MNSYEILILPAKNYMKDYGLRQGDVARKLGISPSHLSQFLSGKHVRVNLQLLMDLYHVLQFEVELRPKGWRKLPFDSTGQERSVQ